MLTSPPVTGDVARRAHVPHGQLAAEMRSTARVPAVYTEPASEERASQLVTEGWPYRLEVEARQWSPILDIYAHAPSEAEAVRLADAAVAALQQRLRSLGDDAGLAANDQVVLRPLGRPRGGVVNAGMAIAVATLTFILTFTLVFLAVSRLSRPQRPGLRAAADDGEDAWPHTARLTPWTFAIFLAVIWLTPFSAIMLNVPSPIDISFDRLCSRWSSPCGSWRPSWAAERDRGSA